jgi:ribonuclease G
LDILIEELEGSLWTAALKNGRLAGLEIDAPNEEVRWGSIYWARVTSINAALDAAFLDLDGENTGVLYNADTRWPGEAGKINKGGAEAIGKRLKPGDFIPVQAKTAYLLREDDEFTGQEHKTPQMSMDITLPGRFLVFGTMLPDNRISSRIRDKKLRKQLESMLDTLEDIQGCILRAAAANTQTDVLTREARILKGAWEEIQTYFKGSDPALIALGPDAIQRTLSDQAARQIDRIEIVTMTHYTAAEEWCRIFAPDLVTKIQPVELKNATQDLALFEHRDVMKQIQDLLRPYVMLPGGGSIILQGTAALTAIDVNKGHAQNAHLAVNIEAAEEIARQIRLRNCGGIIVVDFLKLKSKDDEAKLMRALETAIGEDPCTVQIHGLTKLGLVELTRKRRTPPLAERFSLDWE